MDRLDQGVNGRLTDMTNCAPLALHVPEPGVRPDGTPDFSSVRILEAESVARPAVDAHPEPVCDLAYSIIRVLNREGEAVAPWAGLLSDEELLEGLRNIMVLRAFDAGMAMAQCQGKTSFYVQHMREAGFSVALEMAARLEDVAVTTHAHSTQSEGHLESALPGIGHANPYLTRSGRVTLPTHTV
jgi:2-oxoisovalerate dehydrogenase E1 component alpha subunit